MFKTLKFVEESWEVFFMAKKLNAGQMAKELAELGGGTLKKGGGGMAKGVEVIYRAGFIAGFIQRILESLGLGSRKK